MKTTFVKGRKFISVLSAIVLGSFLIAGCKDDDEDIPVNTTPYSISGNGSGTQVVPANDGTGTSTITGNYYPGNRQFIYTSNWNNLSGAPTTGGFYNGASGVNGTMSGAAWTFDETTTTTGSRTDTLTLTADQAAQLLGGTWYYSYGTNDYPGGEVRGQITATR